MMKIQVLLSAAIIGLSASAASAYGQEQEFAQLCVGYADFETAQMMLHREDISHAGASTLINKSSKKVRDYAMRAFNRCMAAKGNITGHHYCHDDETEAHADDGFGGKCKIHNPWKY